MLSSKASPSVSKSSGAAVQLVLRRAELAARIAHATPADGVHPTALPDLFFIRSSRGLQPVHAVQEPAVCIIAQGAKRVLVGSEAYTYDSSHYMVLSEALPVCGEVTGATSENPYLALRLDIDLIELASLCVEMRGRTQVGNQRASRGLYTGEVAMPLFDAMLRLATLLDTPDDIPTLAPLIRREILYRLLTAREGTSLAEAALADSQGSRIRKAVTWLRQRYAQPLRIEDLAREVNMSPSTLHHRFKAVTALSPLQYQKHIRLQEARRILLIEGLEAATAGHRVGYESAAQFSREYRRMFGVPPGRDLKRMREERLSGR